MFLDGDAELHCTSFDKRNWFALEFAFESLCLLQENKIDRENTIPRLRISGCIKGLNFFIGRKIGISFYACKAINIRVILVNKRVDLPDNRVK
jgi:hypothetical protein